MTIPRLTPLSASGFSRAPWKNGGGVSIDITGEHRPGAEPGWLGVIWRLGRTAIVAPGPFSDLAGYERLQLVIGGRGLVLVTPDGEIDLREPLRPVRYDGGTQIVTRLEQGPVEVVNLIADRTLCAIDLVVPAAGQAIRLGQATQILYAPDGAVTGDVAGQAFAIPGGDALQITGDEGCPLVVTSGTAILATIIRRTP